VVHPYHPSSQEQPPPPGCSSFFRHFQQAAERQFCPTQLFARDDNEAALLLQSATQTQKHFHGRATAMMRELPLSKVYQLRHMMVEFEPPLVACVVSMANHSFAALRATRECVIAIPALELATQVVQVGNSSGRDIDKFEAFGLTPVPAQRVTPPLVAECFANLECKVADTRLVNKYNLFILEVLAAWTDPTQKNPKTIHHHGYGTFVVDGETIKLKSKMR
jgi:flavin reductase (DIM6/NTAB) family NADH-FMN oxidoreductase RutF